MSNWQAIQLYGVPGNMLGLYNIPNAIRDNFAGSFDTCAGSFDRLTSYPVLLSCRRLHESFKQLSAM